MSPNYRVKMKEAMGSLSKKEPCLICCGRNKALDIRHVHLSTNHYNKVMIRQGALTPMCYFCDRFHPIDHMTRQKVILSTSTLSGVQFIKGWGWGEEQPTHVDMETIPGARIATLRKAWERAYAGNPLPIDTVMVAGLNDLKHLVRHYAHEQDMDKLAELVSTDIVCELQEFHKTVHTHSQKYFVDDSVAIASMLHAPAVYWHEDDGEAPTPSYINYRKVVERTNLKIEALNLENGSSNAPGFLQRAGERGLNKGKKRIYRWDAWREVRREDMLHLKDPFRTKMVKCIVKYFDNATPKTYQHLD